MYKKIFFITLFLIHVHYKAIEFHGTKKTLETIITIIKNKETGCYLRFGDGDLNLAYGQKDLYQPFVSENIKCEIREAFALNGQTILKTLPLHCEEFNGLESNMFPGNHATSYAQAQHFLEKAKPLWGAPVTNIYSPVALAYTATCETNFCIHFLKFLKSQNCIAFVGNKNIPQELIHLLFGETIAIIPTSAQNSFSAIDQIESECKSILQNSHEYKIMITSMGCAGRILTKRLWNEFDKLFIFDFGSLMDALCGWNTRAWMELTNFDRKSFLEQLKLEN